MQEPRNEQHDYNPLRHLTPAQFMALGGNAVVYVRPIKGKQLAKMMPEPGFAEDEDKGTVAEQVGELAFTGGFQLRELTARQASLEDAFMDSTGGAVQYQAGKE